MAATEIKLKIHEESDMFSPFDPDQEMLSEDVSEYLSHCYKNKYKKIKENLVIHVVSDTPVNEEHIKRAIREYFEQERSNVKREIKVETIREIVLTILGLVFILVCYFLIPSDDGILQEILSILGWVAIWEAASIAIMRRPELIVVNRICDSVSKAQVIIDVAEKAI